jgi:GRASP55/65 PDZ-like domain
MCRLTSIQGQRTHSFTVVVPTAPQSLGLTLQLAPLNATQNIWHILSIPSPLSPAHLAGLLPHSDYILGTPSGTLHGESALGELVEDHLNRSLVLWVYNSEFDVVREVELIPRRGWGGEGALGAVLGFGALHRLPVGLGEEIQAPGEKLFEAEQRASMEKADPGDGGQFIIPAESKAPMQQPPPFVNPSVVPPPPMVSPGATLTPGAAPTHGKKQRHRGGASPSRAFDDIFEEGAKKSQEQDYVTSRKGTPVAPPPKLGGPGGAPIASPPNISPSHSPAPATNEDIGEPGDAEAT